MSIAILASVAALVVFPQFSAFAPILTLVLLYSAFNAPVSSFTDSATMFMLAGRKELYGRVRLGGTLGYGIAALVAGVLVQNNGLKYAFWGGAIAMLLALLVSQKLVFGEANTKVSIRQGSRALLADRRWFLFLTLALAGGFALTAVNTYFFPYLNELGATESTMGLALTIGTLSEIPVFFFGNRLLFRFRTDGLLRLAMIVTGLRLILFAVARTPEMILVGQLLNGLTFPAMWVAGVAYADQNAPAGMQSTAQGLFGAMVFGLGLAVGGFIGGPILENWGGHALFLIFGVVVLIVVGCAALLQRRWQLAPQSAEA
jgi:PPP family 3-phenylpropionic acid transporter